VSLASTPSSGHIGEIENQILFYQKSKTRNLIKWRENICLKQKMDV
jgi:hypothetical protein